MKPMMKRTRRTIAQCARACMASMVMVAGGLPGQAATPVRTNAFDDPFEQATHAISSCPEAEGPLLTADEARAQSPVLP